MSQNGSSATSTGQRRTSPSQSTSQQTNNRPNPPQTLALEVYHIVRDLVLFFCRRVIFGPVKFKLIVSFAIIIIGSLLKTSGLSPESFLGSSKNFFNVYFVKVGWAWTMGLLIPFIYLTLMTSHTNYQILTRHLVRLLVATGVWYVITSLFVHVEDYTGLCRNKDKQGLSRRACLKGGHEWQEGYELSGHTFLLLYTLLIINEEVKSYDKGTKAVKQASKTGNAGGDNSMNINQEQVKLVSKVIQGLYVALSGLTVLWELMLLTTALYYHHAQDKIMAGIVATFFWYITYYVWYRSESSSILYPSSPKQ